jgi:hypothetical protein
MPPEDNREGILLEISPIQFVSVVGTIASAIVGVTIYVVLNYTPLNSHTTLSQKHDALSGKTTTIIEENAKVPVALDVMSSKIVDLTQDIDSKIAEVEERNLTLRRNVLIRIKDDVGGVANMKKEHRAELRDIEDIMLQQGYLSPASRTQGL